MAAALLLSLLRQCMSGAEAADAVAQVTDLVWGVFVELSIGRSLPLEWTASVSDYSMAVPWDSALVGIRVALGRGETAEEEAVLIEAGSFVLRVPLRGITLPFAPGEASEYVEIEEGEQTVLTVSIGNAEYTIRVIRASIASNGQGEHPDPAHKFPPLSTLSGLGLWDSLGRPARMAWFSPRKSRYFAAINAEAKDVRLVVSPNDPGAEIEWRRDGGKWDYLVPGMSSAPAAVSWSGWTLFDIRVSSSLALSLNAATESLVYQIAVTKELVCHPKCRVCYGPDSTQCLACFAPLILHEGRCLYTACPGQATYYNPAGLGCYPCHPSCGECQDGTSKGCTLCASTRFLLKTSVLDVAGECVTACPFGLFVQPKSHSCERSQSNLKVEQFYLQLQLRVGVDEFQDNSSTLQDILRISAETLSVAASDVMFHRWDAAREGMGVDYYVEVENPFLTSDDVEAIPIDNWFRVLPVPVDAVTVISYARLYPEPVPPLPEPLIRPWMWVAITVVATAIFILYPLYNFYFLARHFEKSRYSIDVTKHPPFMEEVLKNTPNARLTQMAKNEVDQSSKM